MTVSCGPARWHGPTKGLKGESAAGILGASLVSSHGSCLPASAADSPLGLSGDSYHTIVPDDDPELKHTRMLLGAKCSLVSLATGYYVSSRIFLRVALVGTLVEASTLDLNIGH